MSKRIRVLIADDHTIVRSGVRLLLAAEDDMDVVGEARDGLEVLAQIELLQPDVVLMDIAMPGLDGLSATREVKSRWPQVNVLVLTMHREDQYFFETLRAGASGYVLKGAETSDLISALRVVSRGEVFLYPTMAQRLVRDYLSRTEFGEQSGPGLSPREKEILQLLAEGYSSQEIADKLILSPSTIHTHRSNIMSKLGLNTRHELVEYAHQQGLIRSH